ncbi:MAG: hypothetical protein R3F54_17935 [Alphaproteobacteria bacterium]
MGPLAAQLLLESVAAPLLVAGLVMGAFRLGGDAIDSAPALALVLAFAATYFLAFGWPASHALGSHAKIMLATIVGCSLGIAIDRGIWWSRLGLITGAVAIPLWIGLPSLTQQRPESALLLLPVLAAGALTALIGRSGSVERLPTLLTLITLAFGTAVIAVVARTISFAELALALGAALLAILAIGRRPLLVSAIITSALTLLALITALLLYSEASVWSLLMLTLVAGAVPLARLFGSGNRPPTPIGRVLLCCLLPAAAAILIARIDAGSISTY